MPRLDRFTVEFPVQDKTYVVRFSHQHDEAGFALPSAINERGTKVLIKHLTQAEVFEKGGGVTYHGAASCSLKEGKYLWKTGVLKSFKRALCAMGWANEAKQDGIAGRKRGDFIQKDIRFSLAVQSFLRELDIKAYPPHFND